jgi:PQQ-dependent catabolism-associated CXXCW motif protein
MLSTMRRLLTGVLLAASLLPSHGAEQALNAEDRDWGVPATRDIRQAPYTAPTPLEVPGARLVTTPALVKLIGSLPAPLLIDVAGGEGHVTLKGSLWLPNAGRGTHYFDPVQAELAGQLERASAGDKARPLVFFCVNALCWLSYNAALRAVALGYTRVYWYRGGIQAWLDAALPTDKAAAAN